jgi:hypothetical protein
MRLWHAFRRTVAFAGALILRYTIFNSSAALWQVFLHAISKPRTGPIFFEFGKKKTR